MIFDIRHVLWSALSIDANMRKQAEEQLKQREEQNLPSFLLSLSSVLACEETSVGRLAGVILKDALDANEKDRKFELVHRWLSLDCTVKTQIKTNLFETWDSTTVNARSISSQLIAKIAGIEFPHNQWPELIGSLMLYVRQRQWPRIKQATLETLGYLCEEVSPDVIDQEKVNMILTALLEGLDASEIHDDVRLAATRSLNKALRFGQANFGNDMERNDIMRVVLEATRSPKVKIRQAAFECLVSIASTYYDKLALYIPDVIITTARVVTKDEDPDAILEAIEFWSSVCDEEIYILDECVDDFTKDDDIPCFYFIHKALPALVPLLLKTLLMRENMQAKRAWTIAMAGGTCLGLVARAAGDDIVPLVMPFIEENITKSDWRHREAATYAFGSILDGPTPEKLMSIVDVPLNSMLTALTRDQNNHLKDTSAWTLGRMFEFLHCSNVDTPIISQAKCQQIISVLLHSMKDLANVAEKACDALYFLAQGYENAGPPSPLSPFFGEIVKSLLEVTHREDAVESHLRITAYETLNEVVRCSTDETAPIVLQLVPVIVTELDTALECQKVSSSEREREPELQGVLCGCLQVLIQKLGLSEPTKDVFMQYADQMMGLFLRVLACRNDTVHEEAMLAIGALAYATGPDFGKYMPELYKYIEKGLQNFEEYQFCAFTVGVVGDICRALEGEVLPYCDGIMTQLLKNLSSDQLHRFVKSPIFSCFGDIALAMGENFEKYLTNAMSTLQRAAELSVHTAGADGEMTEYTNSTRNGILEAYSGIFQGFKSSPKSQLLIPCASHILEFLDSIYMGKDMDAVVMKSAIGVLGDLADTLGSNADSLIQQSVSSKDLLSECLSSDDHLIKECAKWAKLAISRAISV